MPFLSKKNSFVFQPPDGARTNAVYTSSALYKTFVSKFPKLSHESSSPDVLALYIVSKKVLLSQVHRWRSILNFTNHTICRVVFYSCFFGNTKLSQFWCFGPRALRSCCCCWNDSLEATAGDAALLRAVVDGLTAVRRSMACRFGAQCMAICIFESARIMRNVCTFGPLVDTTAQQMIYECPRHII
jgi:hypothetical protein